MREYTDEEDYLVDEVRDEIKSVINEGESYTLEGDKLKAMDAAFEVLDVTEYRAKIRALRNKLKKNKAKPWNDSEKVKELRAEIEDLKARLAQEPVSDEEAAKKVREAEKQVEDVRAEAESGAAVVRECFETLLEISRAKSLDAAQKKAGSKHSELLDKLYKENQEKEGQKDDEDLGDLL